MESTDVRTEKVFSHPINPAHITVDIAIVVCIEPRFWNSIGWNEKSTIAAFMQDKKWNFVPIPSAGGIKVLVSENPADVPERTSLLARIEQEIGLHHPKKLGLSVHLDCGAYGYSKAFGNDLEKERAVLLGDLRKAGDIMREKFGTQVDDILFYVFTFDGVEQIYI